MSILGNKLKKLSTRFGFVQGMALGLTATSLIAYGVTITSFTPGTTISSSAVNSNFNNLKAAVEKLQPVKVGMLTADEVLTCASGDTFPTDYTLLTLEDESGVTFDTITVAETGYYEINAGMNQSGTKAKNKIAINGTADDIYNNNNTIVYIRKLTAGDQIKLYAHCTTGGGPNSTVNSAKTFLLVRKL